MNINKLTNINDVRESATMFPRPCKLTFDLLTLKVVSESRVTWATCVPILVFLCSRVPDVRDRQTDVRQHHRLMPVIINQHKSGETCSDQEIERRVYVPVVHFSGASSNELAPRSSSKQVSF